MIEKSEIDSKSKELGVHPSSVQRDYVFGWLLSGIAQATDLNKTLILKGGNAFRKAYFEHARYSNDLDFSTQSQIDLEQLKTSINNVCQYVGDKAGISFSLADNKVQIKDLANKNKIYEARVYFKGFYGEENYNLKVKMDIQEFDKIFLPIQSRNIIHSYSDQHECQGQIRCHQLEELLASKLKALLQRRHSPDLYDFVHAIFIQKVLDIDRPQVVSTFLKKTIYQPNPTVAKNLLLELPFQVIKGFWNQYIVCPTQSAIEFDNAEQHFKDAILNLFSAFTYGGDIISSNYFSAAHRNLIMDAGQSQTLLKIAYHNMTRFVEPYSLTYKIPGDGMGKEYFYAWDRTGGNSGKVGIKSFLQNEIQSLEATDEKFEPRYPVEVSRAGELGDKTYFSQSFRSSSGISRPRRPRSIFASPSYTYQCTVCYKKLKSRNGTLRKHKDNFKNGCYGRYGTRVF